MFGFPLTLGRKFDSLFSREIFNEEDLKDWFGFDKQTELSDAKLIDTHRYTEGKLVYEQKVYRLSDNSIFVDTVVVRDKEAESLQSKLERAISEQRFEDAAKLRDQIASQK